jgi:hypothetical protein
MALQQTGSKASEKPYHVLDGGKVRCHVCGKLLRWVDTIETEIGYACEDHILQEDDEPAGGERGQKKPIWKRWRCDRPDCADKLADDGCHCSCPYNPRKCCINHRRKAKWIEVI